MSAVTLVNRGRFLKRILKSNQRKAVTHFVTMTLSAISEVLEALVFFCFSSVFGDSLQNKTLTGPPDYHTSTLIVFCVQRSLKAWKALLGRSPYADFLK